MCAGIDQMIRRFETDNASVGNRYSVGQKSVMGRVLKIEEYVAIGGIPPPPPPVRSPNIVRLLERSELQPTIVGSIGCFPPKRDPAKREKRNCHTMR